MFRPASLLIRSELVGEIPTISSSMEEEKAAAYYEELTRKGEGAARFKQGLGFSSDSKDESGTPARGSHFVSATSSSSLLGSFVRASSPNAASKFEKQAQLESIQKKLKKRPEKENAVRQRDREARVSDRSRDRDRDRERHSRRRSRSRERYRERDRGRDRKRRSRSSSPRWRSDKRSVSPSDRMRSRRIKNDGLKERNKEKPRDYPQLIDGYDKMTPAEKVKAKMKLQLSETAEKDETNGTGSGWERFEFDKDAPLEDEDVEAAEDDAALVKHIGQSFRFSAVEAKREEQIKSAHDEAMFGSSAPDPTLTDTEIKEDNTGETTDDVPAASLLNEKVLARQQGSWRDRARKTT